MSLKFFFLLFPVLLYYKSYGQVNELCDTVFDVSINGVRYDEYNPDKLFKGIIFDYDKWEQKKINTFQVFEPKYYVFKNQYILKAGEAGGGYSYYEVGYTSSKVIAKFKKRINYGISFITDNKIELGISENEFIKIFKVDIKNNNIRFSIIRPNVQIKGKNYSIYYYQCDSRESEPYIQQFSNLKYRPNYIARYIFCNGKLIKYSFGTLPYHPTLEFEDIIY